MGRTLKATSSGIHIFGLAAFAWSLPLFITLSESEDFFVSYKAGRWAVVGFALLCGLILPAAAGLLAQALRRVHSRLDSPIVGGSVALLIALALMPNMKKLPWLPGIAIITLCVMAGALVAHMYFRSQNLRSAFTALAALSPFYVFWFIWQSSIVFPAESDDRPYQLSQLDESRPPVVLVIFDQLSLHAILDENKGINAKTFPNFARLAERSHWFRNASAIAEKTTHALPAILTGRYAGGAADRAPTHNNYPSNAFTLFDALGYDVFASERLTELCPPELNHMLRAAPSVLSETKMFISDILVISGHVYLKEDLAASIPTLEGMVSNFAQHSLPMAKDADAGKQQDLHYIVRRHHDFLKSLENEEARFYVLHLMTPHHPYRMLSSGKLYMKEGPLRDSYIKFHEDWPADPYHAARDMQRYYHQAVFVDGLLGELLNRLEATGLYEDALIAITSDHGVSFRPEYGMRLAVREGETRLADFTNAMDIVKTPTFIKLPHQREGKIIDSPFQLIDIVPTLVDIIAGPVAPASFDGRPMLSPDPPELATYRLFSFNNAAFVEHNLDIMDTRYDVASKFTTLDFNNRFAIRGTLYEEFARGPLNIPLAPDAAMFRATLIDAESYEDVDPSSNFIPAFVRARVNSGDAPEPKTPILITVNGKFGAVALTFTLNSKIWISAVVDEGLFRPGKNEIALYQIDESQTGDRLCRRIDLTKGS